MKSFNKKLKIFKKIILFNSFNNINNYKQIEIMIIIY